MKRPNQPKLIDNRYRVIRPLGRGAMGRVYRVFDEVTRKVRALKMLYRAGRDDAALRRLKREFACCANLRHPNLVRVLDFGVAAGGAGYYTMEYVSGRDLGRAAADLGPADRFAVARQVCRALQYIHARGVIHHDIKPGNIIVSREGSGARGPSWQARLMDFGLAGAQAPAAGFRVKGTPAYVAPEVIRGGPVDHRADFYSLGVVLYELFTGRLPFECRTLREMANSHLNRIPDPPRKVNKSVSPGLQDLILRLMAKDPDRRFQSADEIVAALDGLAKRGAGGDSPADEGYRIGSAPFVGRKKELARLIALYHQPGPARKVVLVLGESGVGKSRLLREFRHYVQLNQGRDFTGRCYERGGSVYQPFRELMRQTALAFPKKERGRGSAERIFPAETGPSLPHDDAILTMADRKMRLFSSVAEFLGRMKSPGVIVIEDLQWIDEASAELLRYLARCLKPNLVLVAACRTADPTAREAAAKVVARMARENLAETMPLGDLDLDEVRELAVAIGGGAAAAGPFARTLREESGGNPLFLEEILSYLAREGKLQPGPGLSRAGGLRRLGIPATIREILLGRIRGVSPDGLNLMKSAAVIGRRFDPELLRKLAAFDAPRFAAALRELEEKQVLAGKAEGADRTCDFAVVKLREIVYENMTRSEKKIRHVRLGRILEESSGPGAEDRAEELSDHFAWADDPARAYRYSLLAGDQAARLFSAARSAFYYRRALELVRRGRLAVPPRALIRLLEKQGNQLLLCGRFGDALKNYRSMLSRAAGHGLEAETINALLRIGTVYHQNGRYERALERGRRALRKARAAGDRPRQASACGVIGLACLHLGKYRQAEVNYETALGIQRRTGDLDGQAHSYNGLGIIKFDLGQTRAALKLYDRALGIYRRTANRPSQAIMHNNIGTVYFRLGEHRQALWHHEESLRISVEVGSMFTQARALYSSANVLNRSLNRYRAAMEKYQAALALSEEIGDREITGHALNAIGDINMSLGSYAAARRHFQRFMSIAEETGDPACKTLGLLNLSGCFYRLGEYGLALDYGRRSVRLGRSTGYALYCAAGYATVAMALSVLGRHRPALRNLDHASRILRNTRSREMEIIVLGTRADVRMAMGDRDAAQALSEELLSAAGEAGNKSMMAAAFLNRARLADRRDTSKRRGCLLEARRLMEGSPDPELVWQIDCEEGLLHQDQGRIKRALDCFGKCLETFKKVCADIEEERFRRSYIRDPRKKTVFAAVNAIDKQMAHLTTDVVN